MEPSDCQWPRRAQQRQSVESCGRPGHPLRRGQGIRTGRALVSDEPPGMRQRCSPITKRPICANAPSAMPIVSNRQLRNPLVLEAAMLQAELHLNVSEFENAVADFGLAEKAASDARLIESQVDAICGAALALFNLKRTSETRALGFKALDLAKLSGARGPSPRRRLCWRWSACVWVTSMPRKRGPHPRSRCSKAPLARRFRCT